MRRFCVRLVRVAVALTTALVLGGDCSIVLGCLLAARRRSGRVGLAYVDAHADFLTPDESPGGSVSNMALSFAVGRGASALARLAGSVPLVEAGSAALIGRRAAPLPHEPVDRLCCGVLIIRRFQPGQRRDRSVRYR